MLHAKVEKLARRMRSAIEALQPEKLPITMVAFPVGSCGDVSLLLGTYLKDSGIPDFEYVSGDRGSHNDNTWTSHAWLARGSLIVDITADQFEDAPGKIIGQKIPFGIEPSKPDEGSHQTSEIGVGQEPITYTLCTGCCVRVCLARRRREADTKLFFREGVVQQAG